MLNYWWVTRPKRKLNSVPEVLATFSDISLNQEWEGQRSTHLSLEDALEHAGLKRQGERRDQGGGGGRTYRAWLESLGLIFTQESTKQIKLTLAGEAIMSGESPVKILKNQILKYQFPSSFSISRNVQVCSRFRIRPFRFMLRLLNDYRIGYLTQEEIAKIVITEAENESDLCFESIVNRILQFRCFGDACLVSDFISIYAPSRGTPSGETKFNHLNDIANTLINWIEYTQLAKRDENKQLRIMDDKIQEVVDILSTVPKFIDRPEQQEFFQRKYGLDPSHSKDTRNLTQTKTITAKIIAEQKIKQVFVGESLKRPISKITSSLVDVITEQTGFDTKLVEEVLLKLYPHGAIGSFMTEYFEMAFKGRDEATEFEKATVEIFRDVFGFEAQHVGPIGLTPDVLILSHSDRYLAIFDNKAYNRYTISNDHKNRMIHNYIKKYQEKQYPLAFFSYIAGGFGKNFDSQLQEIISETGIAGSGINVSNMIKLIENHTTTQLSHLQIKELFSVNRQILLSDL